MSKIEEKVHRKKQSFQLIVRKQCVHEYKANARMSLFLFFKMREMMAIYNAFALPILSEPKILTSLFWWKTLALISFVPLVEPWKTTL